MDLAVIPSNLAVKPRNLAVQPSNLAVIPVKKVLGARGVDLGVIPSNLPLFITTSRPELYFHNHSSMSTLQKCTRCKVVKDVTYSCYY